MPERPEPYGGEAFNPVPDSENRIHSDEVAREHGFEGGLVPGVTVSAYVIEPAVRAWGEAFVESGYSRVVCERPLYDGRGFHVDVETRGVEAYDAVLSDDAGTRVASGHIALGSGSAEPPQRRGDPPAGELQPVEPTVAGMTELKDRGMGAIRASFERSSPMARYFRDEQRMPSLLRGDRGGCANASFLLGLTNWLVAANVRLGPWLHLETEARYFAPVALGEELVVEGSVVDLFDRKGHRFCDVDVVAFDVRDSAVMSARLRAIYRLRPPR